MTKDKLLQALIDAQTDNVHERHGFKTTTELQDETGWSKDKVLKRLRLLKKKGELEVGSIYDENLAGVIQPRTAYRLLSKNGGVPLPNEGENDG